MMGSHGWILTETDDERSAGVAQDVIDLLGSESDILGGIDTNISSLEKQREMFVRSDAR